MADDISSLVERLRAADISGHGSYSALVREAADALLTMESIAVVDKATISAAVKANVALQERAELCEGFELRHRQQIDVLLKQIRLLESDVARLMLGPEAIEAKAQISRLEAERDNHESVAKNNYRIVCELTDELGKAQARIAALEAEGKGHE
jgi:hypothetical protein